MINVTSADAENPTSLFSLAMAEVWESTKEETGKWNGLRTRPNIADFVTGPGCTQRIWNTLKTHLSLKEQRSPFMLVALGLEHVVNDLARRQAKDLVNAVDRILDNIYSWLRASFDQGRGDKSGDAIRTRARQWLPRAREEIACIRTILDYHELGFDGRGKVESKVKGKAKGKAKGRAQ
jgi:hypothetical protein